MREVRKGIYAIKEGPKGRGGEVLMLVHPWYLGHDDMAYDIFNHNGGAYTKNIDSLLDAHNGCIILFEETLKFHYTSSLLREKSSAMTYGVETLNGSSHPKISWNRIADFIGNMCDIYSGKRRFLCAGGFICIGDKHYEKYFRSTVKNSGHFNFQKFYSGCLGTAVMELKMHGFDEHPVEGCCFTL